MPMMDIGEMRVRMCNRQMHVGVRVRLLTGIRKIMRVLMVRVMEMPVRVLK